MEENNSDCFEPLNLIIQSLDANELPEKIAAISTSILMPQKNAFGISASIRSGETGIRLQQTQKIEQFLFCKPTDNQTSFYFREVYFFYKKEFYCFKMLENIEELYQKLNIPYRFVITEKEILEISNKNLIAEIWFPGSGVFQPLIYSNSNDCSAKRIKIQRNGYVSNFFYLKFIL